MFDQSSKGQVYRPVTWDTHLGSKGQWKIKWAEVQKPSGLKPNRVGLLGEKESLQAPSVEGQKNNLLGDVAVG